MATGRIGVTPTLRTRWSKAPAGGTTSLSGLDDNSVSLVYDVGYEAVYRNGVLLSRTNDYTATTGNSITLIDATIAGDIIEVFANQLLPLTNAIGNGQYTAKGALLSATAASTPAVLTVGSNDQVLTADSSTATGLKWATPSAGGMTLINTGGTSLSGSSTSITSIPGTYKNLYVVVENAVNSVNNEYMYLQINSDTGANYFYQGVQAYRDSAVSAIRNASASLIFLCYFGTGTDWFRKCNGTITIPRYAESEIHTVQANLRAVSDASIEQYMFNVMGLLNSTSAITSLQFKTTGGTFSSGKVYVYGVS